MYRHRALRRLAGGFVLVVAGAAASLVCARAPEREAPALRARFIGNEAFEISDGTTTLLSDFPYVSGAHGYMTYDPSTVKPAGDVVCLITHRHTDHFDPRAFAPTAWKIVGPAEVTASLDSSRVVALADRIEYGPLVIEPIRTPHADVEHYCYLVTWHGRRLFFVGDTNTVEPLLAMDDVDVAFLSPWALEALLASGARNPARRVVVYHHAPGESAPSCGVCVTPSQGDVIDIE